MKTFDFALETKSLDEAGLFEGYASTFGNVDLGGDVVEPGAFIESVVKARNERRTIPMLWMHQQDKLLGRWTDIAEDAKGLYVKGKLNLATSEGREKYEHLKEKEIGGMSIGYGLPSGGVEFDDKRRVRRLKKIDLREISLVTMPMNIEARVTSIKSILEAGNMPTVREFEEFLRDAGGFSKSLAAAIASKAAPHLRGEPEAKAIEPAAFLEALLRG